MHRVHEWRKVVGDDIVVVADDGDGAAVDPEEEERIRHRKGVEAVGLHSLRPEEEEDRSLRIRLEASAVVLHNLGEVGKDSVAKTLCGLVDISQYDRSR